MSSTILFVDDDPDILEIYAAWLRNSGYRVLTASNGAEAITVAKSTPIDLVVADLRMPGLSGLHLLTILREIAPATEIIILSGQGTMDDAIEALREGRAFDFLRKPLEDLGRLNLTIEKALNRREQQQQHSTAAQAEARPKAMPSDTLSKREIEVITLVSQGLENREIAQRLFISDKTVKNHLARIYEKLEVANRTKAVSVCQSMGWI
jgi:DNA-binding NarL/FixJ family response regulator